MIKECTKQMIILLRLGTKVSETWNQSFISLKLKFPMLETLVSSIGNFLKHLLIKLDRPYDWINSTVSVVSVHLFFQVVIKHFQSTKYELSSINILKIRR